MSTIDITLATPTPDDGLAVWQLVRDTGVLDVNSSYAYVAHFRHFAESCVVARAEGAVVGFVMGYRLPARPDTYFLWQVGVSAAARGQGLATRALRLLITHLFADGFHRVKARVDPRNTASLRLFDRLGFRREGHERLCYWDAEHGEWTDEVLFAVLSSEWRRQVLPSAHQPLGDECGP